MQFTLYIYHHIHCPFGDLCDRTEGAVAVESFGSVQQSRLMVTFVNVRPRANVIEYRRIRTTFANRHAAASIFESPLPHPHRCRYLPLRRPSHDLSPTLMDMHQIPTA
jgi:hypothetical protein